MKHILTILFSVVYLAAIGGLPVQIHYCKGDLVSVDLITADEDCCCAEEIEIKECCSETTSEKSCMGLSEEECCSFENYFVQYDKENQITKSISVDPNPGKDLLNYPEKTITRADEESITVTGWYSDLPPPNPQPLWKLYCSLTFYG